MLEKWIGKEVSIAEHVSYGHVQTRFFIGILKAVEGHLIEVHVTDWGADDPYPPGSLVFNTMATTFKRIRQRE